MKIGYMRISKGEQTTALQEDALASAHCEKTFRDVMSGAKDERPQFLEMVKFARPGDTIVVWRLTASGDHSSISSKRSWTCRHARSIS